MPLHAVLSPRVLSKQAQFVPPEYSERRGDRELFVWRDPPQWLVVESEVAAFLRALDGRETPGAVAGRMKLGRPLIARARRLLSDLERRGLIRTPGCRSGLVLHLPEPRLPLIENATIRMPARDEPDALSSRNAIALFESAPHLFARGMIAVLAGEEPLARPDFIFEIAVWSARNFAQTVVSTSGELVTDDFAKRASRARLQVEVLLRGPSAESHDAIRGTGSFERSTAGIRALVARGVHTILGCSVDARNLEEIERFYDLAALTGAQEVRLVRIKALRRSSFDGRARPRLLELARRLREVLARRPELAAYCGRDECSALLSACFRAVRRRSCGTGLRRFLIDSDGALYPCGGARRAEFRIANVRSPAFDFPHVWTSSLILAEYRSKTSVERENGGCFECELRHFCFGGCRGETYAASGRLEGRSPWCEDRRAAVLETLWSLSDRPLAFPESMAYCS